jgi:hypothetical protein
LHLVAVYDRALGAAEVDQNFQAGLEPAQSGAGAPTPPALLEAGEIVIGDQWQRIDFTRSLVDPVVVAKPASSNDIEPAVVRIRNVDTTGFEIRVQEWDYLDGVHDPETVGYLAMEQGSHVLADGTRLEAGRFSADNTSSYKTVTFGQAFQVKPVVLSAVASFNESDAVATRMRNISMTDFQFQMQEQEANLEAHLMEDVHYVAWEPSAGMVDGIAFEVGRTGNAVTHDFYSIQFQELFLDIPIFLADMQTVDGGDTANLRWANKDLLGVDVKVAEEQSSNTETGHTSEEVGYILLSP